MKNFIDVIKKKIGCQTDICLFLMGTIFVLALLYVWFLIYFVG